MARTLPWQHPDLLDWTIVGMNHYRQAGGRRLFVAMTKGNRCIQAEGPDMILLWEELAGKAAQIEYEERMLIRAMEEAKAGYAPERNSDFYRGIMHGMQHAIDISRRAVHEEEWVEKMYEGIPPAERDDG